MEERFLGKRIQVPTNTYLFRDLKKVGWLKENEKGNFFVQFDSLS